MGKIHLRHSAGEWICMVRLEDGNSSGEVEGEVKTKGIMPLLRVCSSLDQTLQTWYIVFSKSLQLPFSSRPHFLHSPIFCWSHLPRDPWHMKSPSTLGLLWSPFRYKDQTFLWLTYSPMKLKYSVESREVSVDVFSHLSEDMVDIWVHKTPSMSVFSNPQDFWSYWR